MAKTRNNGFTLVELLVVVTIIAVLGTLSAVVGPKILKKGRQSSSVNNMRQINTFLASYAADNSNRLPAPVTLNDNEQEIYWHTVLQSDISNVTPESLLSDAWWKQNDSLLINPLLNKSKVNHKIVGYGMNAAIAQNIERNRDRDLAVEDALYTAVNLNAVSDSTRTPVILPFWNWAYIINEDNADHPNWEEISVGGRVPVLFLDGHTELMTPIEYVSRHLGDMPKP